MAVAKKKKAPAKSRKNGAGAIDLEKFRAELDPVGQELFDIAMSIPEEELMSTEEIRAEIARRRGGIVIIQKK
jgi:hypothetical protein